MVIKSNETLACEHCGAEADMVVDGFESVQDVIKKAKEGKKPVVCKSCGQEVGLRKVHRGTLACEHCGAEADMVVEGFESVQDVIEKKKKEKKPGVCKHCGKEILAGQIYRDPASCDHCGAEADMTIEGIEKVEDVIHRTHALTCTHCGKDISWTRREDLKAIEVAMGAEKEASQFYAKASKMTKDPRGRDMFQQLSEFEMNHFNKLKDLAASIHDRGEWVPYGGTPLNRKALKMKAEKLKGQDQLTDMDALKMGIQAEKKAGAYYRSMAELTPDPLGKEMYKRLAQEEELHEKLLNDQYYSLHNTGIWSWGD